MARLTLAPVKSSPSFLLGLHPSRACKSLHPQRRAALKRCPCTILLSPREGHKKERWKIPPLPYLTASLFLRKTQQVSWGPWKAQSFHVADLLTGNMRSKTPLASCVPSNLASLTDCIWKLGYFHKRHNPKSKHLKLLEGNTEQNKNTQLMQRRRVISVEHFAEELSETQENKVLSPPS